MLTKTPHGLQELTDVFGDPNDPGFEKNNIVLFKLPYLLLYDGRPVSKARCHRLIVDNFIKAFTDLKDAGLDKHFQNYGGIYAVRSKRGQSHPSTHSWGIAIDGEPAKYPLGSAKRFPDGVVAIFKAAGFFYGGDFSGRLDPMHFQFVTGY